MVRPGLTVTSQELKAYLNDSDADSSLDKAFADGTAKIVSNADKRTRTGTSEHAEYYTTDQKVILDKGEPLLVDSLKGKTQGKQLTWWANNDRLLVNGVEDRPADSTAPQEIVPCALFKQLKSPRRTAAGRSSTTSRSGSSRARWWGCWVPTARARPLRFT